jgi:hypothetical protein
MYCFSVPSLRYRSCEGWSTCNDGEEDRKHRKGLPRTL